MTYADGLVTLRGDGDGDGDGAHDGAGPSGVVPPHASACKAPQMPGARIRPAARGDLVVLREIEVAAGERFREHGLDHVADDEPFSVEVLAVYAAGGRAWVAVDDSDRPVGYVLVDVVDGCGHIEQVTVVPHRQGQGIGRALVERARAWAAARGLPAVTLRTFAHIPWNRPLYEHLGFHVVPGDDLGPDMRRLVDAELRHGFDPATRVVMRVDVESRAGNASMHADTGGCG